MKILSPNNGFRALCAVVVAFVGIGASASIPIAGIYEMNENLDMSRHQMYLELDFINSRPDFTQTFTGKNSEFKLLPSDFMNAKKLSHRFEGTTAPGFGKYRHKMLFSSSEEFRITNPRLKKGIVLVDWENGDGVKGEAIIIPNPDGSLVTYGLTTFDRLIGPDSLRLEFVRDLLPRNGNSGGEKEPVTISTDGNFVEEIKTICAYPGVADAIKRLRELPDDGAAPAPATPQEPVASEPVGTQASEVSGTSTDKPDKTDTFHILVGNDGSTWKGSMSLAQFGQSGLMSGSATFADGGDGTLIMNMIQEIAPGGGKVHRFEYIYYGKVVGQAVVFDKIAVAKRDGTPVPGAKPKPVPKGEPNVITLLSPDTFDFSGMKFRKLQ